MSDQKFPYTDDWIKLMAEYLQVRITTGNPEKYQYNDTFIPVIFLAWAPWAGKTEWIESFPDIEHYVILDTDLYRSFFEGYTGSNASDFHQYASRVMDRMYSFCIKNRYNMIVDGTFSNVKKTEENIAQCRKKWLAFSIILVMQDPIISYLYTKKREQEKLRNVPMEAFIEKFYKSIQVVKEILIKYPQGLVFITKKLKSNPKFSDVQVKNSEQFDKLTKYEYNSKELKQIIEQLNHECQKNPWFLTKILWLLLKNNLPTWKNL